MNARRKYYCDMLQSNKNYLTKVWKIINDLIVKTKIDSSPSFFMKDINIANEFNNYFVSIASLAKAKLNNSSNSNVSILISKFL